MDKLYIKGLSQLFTLIALGVARKYGVSTKSSHLDSSSFHLHGKYENNLPKVAFISGGLNLNNPKGSEIEETVAQYPIEITYGYSSDHRPDLKQFILDLICRILNLSIPRLKGMPGSWHPKNSPHYLTSDRSSFGQNLVFLLNERP
jgi:transposase